MLAKLKSRKYQAMLIAVVVGLLTLFGVPDETVKIISAIATLAIPAIYTIVEGIIDHAGVTAAKTGSETVGAIIKILQDAGIVKGDGTVAKIEEIITAGLVAAKTGQTTAGLPEDPPAEPADNPPTGSATEASDVH